MVYDVFGHYAIVKAASRCEQDSESAPNFISIVLSLGINLTSNGHPTA